MTRLTVALLGFGAICCSVFAQSYTFTTFAGLPPQIGTTDGGPNDARFNFPAAVVVDTSGNTFVAWVQREPYEVVSGRTRQI